MLIKELKSREPSLRYETAHACGELGDEAVVPHLICLLQDEDYQVQLAGLTALGKIGGSLAKRALLRCIKEGDAALEEAARAALENVEFPRRPPGLCLGIFRQGNRLPEPSLPAFSRAIPAAPTVFPRKRESHGCLSTIPS